MSEASGTTASCAAAEATYFHVVSIAAFFELVCLRTASRHTWDESFKDDASSSNSLLWQAHLGEIARPAQAFCCHSSHRDVHFPMRLICHLSSGIIFFLVNDLIHLTWGFFPSAYLCEWSLHPLILSFCRTPESSSTPAHHWHRADGFSASAPLKLRPISGSINRIAS